MRSLFAIYTHTHTHTRTRGHVQTKRYRGMQSVLGISFCNKETSGAHSCKASSLGRSFFRLPLQGHRLKVGEPHIHSCVMQSTTWNSAFCLLFGGPPRLTLTWFTHLAIGPLCHVHSRQESPSTQQNLAWVVPVILPELHRF